MSWWWEKNTEACLEVCRLTSRVREAEFYTVREHESSRSRVQHICRSCVHLTCYKLKVYRLWSCTCRLSFMYGRGQKDKKKTGVSSSHGWVFSGYGLDLVSGKGFKSWKVRKSFGKPTSQSVENMNFNLNINFWLQTFSFFLKFVLEYRLRIEKYKSENTLFTNIMLPWLWSSKILFYQ